LVSCALKFDVFNFIIKILFSGIGFAVVSCQLVGCNYAGRLSGQVIKVRWGNFMMAYSQRNLRLQEETCDKEKAKLAGEASQTISSNKINKNRP
jgi:hypothetical protein